MVSESSGHNRKSDRQEDFLYHPWRPQILHPGAGDGHDVLCYACYRGWLDNGEAWCIAFGGVPVDEAVGREALQVVQPAAVEAAVIASEEEARRQDDALEALKRDLEAARYAARRAQRQYDSADPENRLRQS